MTGPTPAVDLAAGPAVPDRDDAWAEAHTRALDDPAALRRAVFDRALEAANALPPAAHNGFTLTLAGADYVDPDHVPLAAQKEALLSGRTLGRRLKGTWVLTGPDGQELHRRSQIVARVPYVTDRGTVVHNGSDYGTKHQTRLRPGVYVRPTADGKYEAQVNAAPGDGVGHRYRLDPATSVFRVAVGQSEVPLLPLARALGATDDELQAAWGEKVWAANRQAGTPADLKKLFDRLVPKRDQQALAGDPAAALRQALSKIRLDPLVARRTLPGGEHPTLSKDALLAATKRVLAVARGEDEGDDRDHLAYQSVHGLEDLIAERLKNDHSYYRRDLVREAAKSGRLDHVPSGALTRQIEQVLLGSGLGASLEESSPAELLDKLTAVTRMGEGGIHSTGTIPVDARSVHPSQLGYVDILRTPESDAAGVDLYFAAGARKGHDGQAYTRLLDAKTGKPSWQSPADIADKVVAFPEALKPRKLPAWAQEEARRIAGKPHPTDEEKEVLEFVRTFDPTPARVPALVKGKLEYVAPREVDYVLPHFEPAFSPLGQFVPGRSAAKGQRASMAARMLAQALPLVKPEAPLVRTQLPDGRSPEEAHAGKFGAVRAAQDGTVEAVTPDGVTVRHADGTVKTHEIANHFPYNRKTALHQTALVKPGDPVKAGQLLATSNFTDETGHAALGANLRVAYLPWHGPDDYEDAVIVSESAARRLTSSHAYKVGLPGGPAQPVTADKHKALFPGRYTAEQLAAIGDDGAVRVGTRVSQGDPLVLAAAERPLGGSKTLKRNQPAFADHTQTWDYADPGVVTDVVPGPDGPTVLVTAERQARVGDKLSGRYGDKGIISRVLPDDQMPQTPAGPAEVLVSPTGVVSRANPAQMIELALGGVARKLGRPVTVPDFDDIDDLSAWARDLARQHGVSTLADVTDPVTGRTVKGVPTGERFFLKLHHQAEDKLQARDGGGYDSEGRPSKGGAGGAKRLSLLDTTALLAHGAYDTLRDGLLVRGGQNDDYWAAFLQGHAPPDPDVPLPYRKFVSQLQASGINVVGDGPRQRLLALTDADVDQMAGDRVVSAAEAVRDVKGELKPVPGGLFDPQATGGFAGSQWAAVKLHEPLPNPTFEQPIKSLLGLTTPKFEKVLSGEEKLPGGQTGPAGIKQALASLDVPRELDRARQEFAAKKGAARDAAARRIGYLKTLARTGQKPEDWVLSKVPVLPPVFRPVSRLPDGTPVVADANYLYLELLEADKNLRELKGRVGDSGVGPERLAAYRAFQALTGLADPQQKELKQKGVRGLLAEVTGDSPKFGCFDDQTEILTADGWRRFDAVEVGTVVATLNPETAAFEWQPAQVVHRYPYDGHLFAFETKRGLDFVVTADHRNWVRNRIGKPDNRGIEEGWGFEPAYVSATHGNRKWYRTAATTWKGHAQRPAFLPEACSLEDFAEFVGWWAAEGWLGDRDKKCVQILQSLKKGYCVERIGRVIDALGLKYGVGDYWRGAETLPDGRPGEKTLCRQWSIRSKELAEWLATHVGQLAEAKRLSSAVRDWDTPYLVAFFRGYLAGDGELWGAQRIETDDPRHKNRAEVKLDHGRSSTTSIELAGNLQEMACKIGYRSTIVPLDPLEGCENCKPAWRVNLSSSRFAVTEGNAFTGLIRYTGVVSCVTVPNGVVYVRRNGRPMFSGNSVQRNLLSATVDNVGRGVLVPDGELDMDSVGLPENLAFGSYGRYVVRRLARQGMPVTRALKEVKDRTDRARQALVEEMGQRPVLVSRAPTWHKFGILALKPRLVAEDVIRLSPLVFKGYGADSDGDQMNVHVPASESAVQEAYDRLLPSRNLFHPANLKSPIHQFGQDYLAGLHQATAPAAADKPVKKYATRREALAAFRRGEVGLNDPVEVAG